jgi:hypothetical protein
MGSGALEKIPLTEIGKSSEDRFPNSLESRDGPWFTRPVFDNSRFGEEFTAFLLHRSRFHCLV